MVVLKEGEDGHEEDDDDDDEVIKMRCSICVLWVYRKEAKSNKGGGASLKITPSCSFFLFDIIIALSEKKEEKTNRERIKKMKKRTASGLRAWSPTALLSRPERA